MMYLKKLLLLSLLLSLTFTIFAQSGKDATIKGLLTNDQGESLAGASISLPDHTAKTISDTRGQFTLQGIRPGKRILIISLMGYKRLQAEVNAVAGETATVNLRLQADMKHIETVSVIGRTPLQDVQRQAYNLTAIDAKKLHNTTLDLAHALDRVSGIRVREDGGLGSRMSFSLNGFSGRQVKMFIDGIPMENFGSSFQLNNIPINLAERVEVYKGVVPVWLGADALGGAVNIVTSNVKQSYLDASYSYGSFNTHRSAINAAYVAQSGFTAQLNAFQNYSDNDYKVRVQATNLETKQYYPATWVRRFNDTYHNETVIANIGVVGKKYADKLLVGITLGQNYAELQTGARMKTVYGQLHRRGNIVMPTFKYQVKDLFVKGLNLTVNGNYNLGTEQVIDTVSRLYNWFGQWEENTKGAERERSMYKFKNNNGIGTANLNYRINEHHLFSINNVYTTFNRKGSDELFPDNARYEQPQKSFKNVLGLSYQYDYNEKWTTSVFAKNYNQVNKFSESYNPTGGWGDVAYRELANKMNNWGYGAATAYFILPTLQVKASYEKSYRLPEGEELFGDMQLLEGNVNLRPESSNNYNVGASWQTKLNDDHRFSVDANFLYRNATDFIRPTLNRNQIKQSNENLGGITNVGVDGEIRYSFKRIFTAGVNMTYQNLRNNTKFESGEKTVSPTYRDRIPNIPYMFGNADASLFFRNVLKKGNHLTVGYNFQYVHAFYLSWPGQGTAGEKLTIPRQFCQDVNLVYSLADGRYNVAFECKNLVNNRNYDNFSLQKPGRAFNVKLRYFISKK